MDEEGHRPQVACYGQGDDGHRPGNHKVDRPGEDGDVSHWPREAGVHSGQRDEVATVCESPDRDKRHAWHTNCKRGDNAWTWVWRDDSILAHTDEASAWEWNYLRRKIEINERIRAKDGCKSGGSDCDQRWPPGKSDGVQQVASVPWREFHHKPKWSVNIGLNNRQYTMNTVWEEIHSIHVLQGEIEHGHH